MTNSMASLNERNRWTGIVIENIYLHMEVILSIEWNPRSNSRIVKNYLVICPIEIHVFEVFIFDIGMTFHIVFLSKVVSMIEYAFDFLLLQYRNDVVSQLSLSNHAIYVFPLSNIWFKHLDDKFKLSRVILVQLQSICTSSQNGIVDHLVVVGISYYVEIFNGHLFHKTIHYYYFFGVSD